MAQELVAPSVRQLLHAFRRSFLQTVNDWVHPDDRKLFRSKGTSAHCLRTMAIRGYLASCPMWP
eukprot:12510583-Alexandrium_andersonii.AAC.1